MLDLALVVYDVYVPIYQTYFFFNKKTMNPVIFFKSLADDTRLSILLLVYRHNELCVCELTAALKVSQPKISRHLALLKQHQILIDEKREQWVYYRLHPQLLPWCTDVIQQTDQNNRAYLSEYEEALASMGDRPLREKKCR